MRSDALTINRLRRLGGFLAGVLLFYAPFALLVRAVGALSPRSLAGTSVSDAHTACLRMPWSWMIQPWMWPTLGGNPISWLPLLVLPVAAIAAGPLFCGWLCPAGALPEFLGRIVPDRFKVDLKQHTRIVPLRYGFFVGFLLAPFVSASICCSFCNFTHMQNIVSATFGDPAGLLYFTTMGFLAGFVWIVALGMMTVGGRGWCLFLCPAGTMQGLASRATARFGWSRRVRADGDACTSCGTCASVCSMRAVDVAAPAPAAVDHNLCNDCFDCTAACPTGAMRFGARR